MPIRFCRLDWGWESIVLASYPRTGGAGGGTGWYRRTDQRFPTTIVYWVYQTAPQPGSFHFGASLSNATLSANEQAMCVGHHTGTSLAPADDSYAFGVYRNAVGRVQNESANPNVPDSGWSMVHVRFPAGPAGPVAGHSGANEGTGGGTPGNTTDEDCITVGGEYQHTGYPSSFPVAWSAINPMMHYAVWNADLTASELRAMGQNRVSPLLIRPSALRLYYPLFDPGDGGHEYQTGYCLRYCVDISSEPNQPRPLRGFDGDTGRATVNYNGTRGKSHHRFLQQPEGFITPHEYPGYHQVLKARGLSQLLNSRSPIGTKIGGLVR